MTEYLVCIPAYVEVDLTAGGSTHLSYFRGQKLVVHFCPATAAAELAAFDALRDDFADAGAWLVTADPADREAFYALAGYFPEFGNGVPEDGATFVIDRDGIPRYVWPGFGNAREALLAVCVRP
jgi:peroxiredoxin